MTEDHESLEVAIENAWLDLFEKRGAATFFVTPRGRLIRGIDHGGRNINNIEIGTYDKRVRLQDFRADVFEAYEEARRSHG